MSLINEALKKAQKQREPSAPVAPAAPPTAGTPPPARPAAPPSAAPAPGGRFFLLMMLGACAIIAVSVAITVYLLRSDGERSAPAVAHAVPQPAAEAAAANVPAPGVAKGAGAPASPALKEEKIAAAPSVSAALAAVGPKGAPGAQPEASVPALPAATPVPIPATPVAEAPVPAASAPPVVAFDPARAANRIQAMVDKFRVSGIRLAGSDSKVILNDHLFREGDVIESSIGLRLVKIEPHRLSFADAEGHTYQKRF